MIAIIDYGMGNLGSIKNMLTRLDFDSEITSDPEVISESQKLILPGVGAFDNAMKNLESLGFIDLLNEMVLKRKKPILGICLGMQLLSERSEEGQLNGLGWIEAETIRFDFDSKSGLRIPHMGWNEIEVQRDSCLFKDMYEEPRFYFVHSYHVNCRSEEVVLSKTHYGIDFVSSLANENINGVQFHPEKSHKFGMKLLGNFARLC